MLFTDPDGLADAQALSITVGQGAGAPVISTTSLPNGSVGSTYTTTMQTVGNKTGTWSIPTGAFPPGLTGNPATGVISGTPTATGTYPFTAQFVETATGLSDTQTLSITITAATAPVISTTTLPWARSTRRTRRLCRRSATGPVPGRSPSAPCRPGSP